MNYDNVKLWFAKNQDNNIITIDDINDENKNNTYLCPMCGSKLIPKAIKSKQITSHFAHVDASKCNSETMIHWWFKNKFLVQGDKFVIKSNVEKEYVCREVLVEQNYIVGDKAYRPDVTVLTECGKTIFFEMDYSNKKKVSDYIDIWLELKNIVVEVDIKKLMMKDKIPVFKALFYNGKCFNIKKNDIYYNTIGKYKEGVYQSGCSKERKEKIKKLDWFWDDVFRYKSGEVDIDYMVDLIDCIEEDEKEVVDLILNKPMCVDLYKNYIGYKTNKVYAKILDIAIGYFGDDYNNYFKQNIRYNWCGKKYSGYIDMLDASDNCFCMYDIFRHNEDYIVEQSILYFNKIIKKQNENKRRNVWDEQTKEILSILNSNEVIEICKKDLNKNGYSLDLWFCKDYKNERTLNVAIKFKSSGVVAERYEFEIVNKQQINNICIVIQNNINKYFLNLDKIRKIDEFKNITNFLINRYSKVNKDIEIVGNIWLENIYEVLVFGRFFKYHKSFYLDEKFYITNDGVLEGCRSNNIIYKYTDFKDLERYLIDKISTKIRNEIYK